MGRIEIPERLITNWERIVKIIAELLDVPIVLINRMEDERVEILQANISEANPFKQGDELRLAGHFCEEVVEKKEMLIVENALQVEKWQEAPELDYGLISYLGFPILTSDGSVLGTICVLDREERNYTESEIELLYQLKRVIEYSLGQLDLNKKLQKSRKFVQSILDSLEAHIAVLDNEGIIRYTNRAWRKFAEQNGLPPTECSEGINYLEVCERAEGEYSEEAPRVAECIKEIMAGRKEIFTLEYPCHSPEEKRWFKMRVRSFSGGSEYSAVIAHENITERKLKEEEMRYCSFHDQLTGLYNRRYFQNELERLNDSRKLPISIIVGDMDGLKDINDTYGHKMGDKFLQQAAKVIASATRSEDILARLGGDEFALILPETSKEEAKKICERTKLFCSRCNQKGKLPESLSISLGYATKNEKREDLNEIFRKADKRMYENKGRRRVK